MIKGFCLYWIYCGYMEIKGGMLNGTKGNQVCA